MSRRTIDEILGMSKSATDYLKQDLTVSSEMERLRKQVLDYEESPSMKAARKMLADLDNDPMRQEANRLMAEYTARLAADPIHQQGRTMMEELRLRTEADPAWQRLQAQIASAREQFYHYDGHSDAATAYTRLLAVGSASDRLADSFGKIGATFEIDSLLGRTGLINQMGAVARANQWSRVLSASDVAALTSAFSTTGVSAEIDRVQRAAAEMLHSAGPSSLELTTVLGLANGGGMELASTRVKLAALAGSTDVLGVHAGSTLGAYGSIFGEWHTRPDLPVRFWRDPAARRRMYRDADVDEGLVEADIGTALEVVVESGLASGFRADSGSVAIIPVGRLSMSIRSVDTRVDTYQVLGTFEEELRDFISRKLAEKAGPQWFKQRVHGDIAGRARDTAAAAAKQGEKVGHLIEFTQLGDLASIVLSKANWSEVFEPVFVNQSRFNHDMQTVNATRRPTAHFRKIDAVRMVEVICVIDRLSQLMRDDGAWQRELDTDD